MFHIYVVDSSSNFLFVCLVYSFLCGDEKESGNGQYYWINQTLRSENVIG